MKIKSNRSTGHILVVDLEYVEELYLEHSDYP